ncbi:class I adenylate-forming enzyme family protein [Phenylobacterium sp. LjRoot225]|uniref:class I adenylate-forming enzyme family protein n=1 Tax=Phenylobacterium sp. LjRoot225 TaxID=3342285 RepID=UPI003ECD38EE
MHATEPASTFPMLFGEVVAARGPHDAVVTTRETLSYDELNRRSARMARALLAIGAGKGARIALHANDGILWVTTFLAGLRIGALVSVVSTLCTPPELAHILRNSDTQIFIGVRRFLRHDYAATLAEALPGLSEGRAETLRLAGAPYLRSIWLDDAEGLGWALSVEDLLARADAADAPDAALLAAIEGEVAPSDDAVIVYTSGSTSAPKAVVHSQRNLARHPPELAKYFLLKPGDRMLPQLPAFWLGGMAMAMEVLSVGATLVYPDTPDTEAVVDAIQRLGVNRVNSWGDLLVKLRQAAAARGVDVDAIVGLGPFRDADGELIPPGLQVNMLGMSETFAVHSAEPLDHRLPDDKAGSSGRTVGGYERRVVDPGTGTETPPGELGELQLRGGALMSGFYKVDRSKAFAPDGFYPTSDLVRLDADGHLYFVARRGDMIKTKAANVSRLEVEAALRALPGVDLPIVVGLADPEFGQRVVAAVVPKEGAALSEDALKATLKGVLSSYKIPRQIVFIGHEDVPRTATGKLKLFELADMISAQIGEARPAPSAAQSSSV